MATVYVPDVGDGLVVGLCGTRLTCGCRSTAVAAEAPTLAARQGAGERSDRRSVLPRSRTSIPIALTGGVRGRHRPRRQRIRAGVFSPCPRVCGKAGVHASVCSQWQTGTFGHVTGSMEADFLRSVSRINACAFGYRALSQGDRVLGCGEMEVLWPPRAVDGEETVAAVRRAI